MAIEHVLRSEVLVFGRPYPTLRFADAYFNVWDVCGAPGSAEEWVIRVATAAQRPMRFDPMDKVSELEARRLEGPNDGDLLLRSRWSTQLCLLRHRYLASFFPAENIGVPRVSFDPAARDFWNEWQAAKKAVERAERSVARARRAAEKAHLRYGRALLAERWKQRGIPPHQIEETMRWSDAQLVELRRAQIKTGRRGNPTLRATMKALTRLYSEMHGIVATHTARGPAVRFASAFFSGLDAKWKWASARDVSDLLKNGGTEINWRYLRPILVPQSGALRDLLRTAIARAPRDAVEPRMEIPALIRFDQHCPVQGAFVAENGGGENWGTSDGKMPPIFHLAIP